MNCIRCDNQLGENDIFCNRCGRKIEPKYSKYPGFAVIYNRAMTILYAIAILACFICNLAVEQTLSWFFIVLSAVALAYSVTNIPVIAGKHKAAAAGVCATAMVYVLLYACNWFARGDWLFSIAYPLATLSLLYAWIILAVCISRKISWLLKSALISLVAGAATITVNPLCNYLIGEPVRFYDYFSPVSWPLADIGNKIAFICCISYSLIVLIPHAAKIKAYMGR